MTFLADEGLDRQIVDRLRQDGYDVLYIAEMEPSISDDVVLSLANEHDAILITSDKDFGELVFRLRRINAGVVLVRLAGVSSEAKADKIAAILREHGSRMQNAFTVISRGMVRIRPRM